MTLNFAEHLLVNNPARALVQRWYEGPLLRRLGGRVDGGCVLDVGCGRGVGLQVLLEQFGAAEAFGVDLDPRQIARAQKRFAAEPRVSLAVASVEQLPFPDASFDAVFDFGMLHHMPVWQHGVVEIARVLKSGGTFFFEEVTRAALERWWYRTFLEHPAENRFNEEEFVAQLHACGMEPVGERRRVWLGDIFIGVAMRC